jgi:antitoxin (DNA-binding transcriptional repressor) of toxin-antitoxin stability system
VEIANIHEARSQLSKRVEHAMNGEEVIIARAGQPMVLLVPIHAEDSPPGG